MSWDQAYREAWVYLVLMVGVYVALLVSGSIGWPW